MTQRGCQSVGIDLGTTYSSLAYVDAQGLPRIVSDSGGQAVMPSVVFFDEDDIIVGEMALGQAKLRADRVVQFIKVQMGDMWRQEVAGRVHTPESISAIILGQLIKEAEPQIGPIRSAVVTVPAYFTEKRRRATQQAGEIAGLEVIGTLNEPMAATLAYGLHRLDRQQQVVVYDLGGGTFDVTVVRISPGALEELATTGNRQLGGRDWDQALIDFVADDFQKAQGSDVRDLPQAMQDLQLECEQAKRRLGRMGQTSIRLHADGRDHRVDVTREKFEQLTAHLLGATKLTTETAIAEAGLQWSQISRVVLVGGATHMPCVRRMLEQISGKPPDTGVNPVLAVALGAAVYAHMLETGQARKLIRQRQGDQPPAERTAFELGADAPSLPPTETVPLVRFVTAHGVGVKVRSGDRWTNKVLIPKNTQVPAKVTRRFLTKATGSGGTQIKIDITQGDTPDLAAVEELGTGRLEGLPPGEPDGQPVDVTMEFDQQGRLHIHALYVPRKQQMEMSLEIPGGLKPEEVEDHRRFLEMTGFLEPLSAKELLEDLENAESIDSIPSGPIDRVFSLEELYRALGAEFDDHQKGEDRPDDDLPMIEPVD